MLTKDKLNLLVSAEHLQKMSGEMAAIFKTIIEAIDQLKAELSQNVALNNAELTDRVEIALSIIEGKKAELEDLLSQHKSKVAVDIDLFKKQIDTEVKRIEALIPQPTDLTPLEEKLEAIRAEIPTIPEMPPELTSDEIMEKVNDEEAPLIKKERIEGLEDELKRLETTRTGMRGGVRRVFQPYRDDFSDDTDGSTKTFYLSRAPLDEGTVMVYGTDFPVILRPTIDFTISNKTLTLTSAVPAPTEGATLMVTYFA